MNKILVIGGCGFIGSHVADIFSKKGFTVFIVDNLSTGKLRNKPEKAILYRLDVRDRKKLDSIFNKTKPDIISHHASSLVGVQQSIKNPLKAFEDIEITTNIAELARDYKVKQIIFSSSANVYAKGIKVPINEDARIYPLSPYGITKLSIESYLNYISSLFGTKITILRYFNVYGLRQRIGKEGIIPILIASLKGNKKIVVYGGDQTRDFVYVEDVAYANFLAAKNHVEGTFNIGSGKGVSINTLVKTLGRLLRKKAKTAYKKKFMEIDHSVADISKAKYSLGWEPKTSLEEGLKKTIEFYKK